MATTRNKYPVIPKELVNCEALNSLDWPSRALFFSIVANADSSGVLVLTFDNLMRLCLDSNSSPELMLRAIVQGARVGLLAVCQDKVPHRPRKGKPIEMVPCTWVQVQLWDTWWRPYYKLPKRPRSAWHPALQTEKNTVQAAKLEEWLRSWSAEISLRPSVAELALDPMMTRFRTRDAVEGERRPSLPPAPIDTWAAAVEADQERSITEKLVESDSAHKSQGRVNCLLEEREIVAFFLKEYESAYGRPYEFVRKHELNVIRVLARRCGGDIREAKERILNAFRTDWIRASGITLSTIVRYWNRLVVPPKTWAPKMTATDRNLDTLYKIAQQESQT